MAIVDIHGDSDIDGDGNGAGDGLDLNGQGWSAAPRRGDSPHGCCLSTAARMRQAPDLDAGRQSRPSAEQRRDRSLPELQQLHLDRARERGVVEVHAHGRRGPSPVRPPTSAVGDTVAGGRPRHRSRHRIPRAARDLHHEIALPSAADRHHPVPKGRSSRRPAGDPRWRKPRLLGDDPRATTRVDSSTARILAPFVCDIPGNLYVDNKGDPTQPTTLSPPTRAPTPHRWPTRAGRTSSTKGSTVQLDGTGSSDPENAILQLLVVAGDQPRRPDHRDADLHRAIDDTGRRHRADGQRHRRRRDGGHGAHRHRHGDRHGPERAARR